MEAIIASVFAPALVDLFKGLTGAIGRKFIGVSVDDQIKLEQSSVDKLKALASIDNPYGTPSQWVINLRASFRYFAAAGCIAVGTFIMLTATSPEFFASGYELTGMPFGFIFGERMYLGLKGAMNK